ncbi:phasin family protein [Pseudomonas sp. gcc21]|uniref:phasin family protein n=1 Tax=Pseudomonas sp. gcc21 TaxID=2726989 RepID=UPI0014511CC8|nr:phasin family protein [Pseudomonas sp. gcc21]QJD60084.1 phasin family protein [Pseudomonas sp. gcc21]
MVKLNTIEAEEHALAFAGDVRKYAHQIWLAGLGVYAKAGKDSAEYFKTLVSEGEQLEQNSKEFISERIDAAGTKVASLKERLQERNGGSLHKVEEMFDERVASALERMGIPNKSDIEQLSNKLDMLSASLRSMQAK